MRYYPAFLDLTGKRCLVVGAGRVGQRKLASLLDACPAEVLLVDPRSPTPELIALLARPGTVFARRVFVSTDLDGRFLVLAASGDRAANNRIAALCAKRGILCNVADAPGDCSFMVPAHFSLGDLTVAVSTAGLSPTLSRIVARDLRDQLASRYETLLTVLGRLRPMVLIMERETERNAELFHSLVTSPLADRLAADDKDGAADCLRRLLPPELHDNVNALLAPSSHIHRK